MVLTRAATARLQKKGGEAYPPYVPAPKTSRVAKKASSKTTSPAIKKPTKTSAKAKAKATAKQTAKQTAKKTPVTTKTKKVSFKATATTIKKKGKKPAKTTKKKTAKTVAKKRAVATKNAEPEAETLVASPTDQLVVDAQIPSGSAYKPSVSPGALLEPPMSLRWRQPLTPPPSA